MRIKAIHTYLLSTAKLSGQTTYEETAGLVLPERAADTSGYRGRLDERHRCVYPRDRSTLPAAWKAKAGCAAGAKRTHPSYARGADRRY